MGLVSGMEKIYTIAEGVIVFEIGEAGPQMGRRALILPGLTRYTARAYN
jgi:hypothetical protein